MTTLPPLRFPAMHAVVLLLWLAVAGFGLTVAQAAGEDATVQDTATLIFAGDIMLDDGPGEQIARGADPFGDLAGILKSADVTIGNLECVISDKGTRVEKPYTFRAHPRVMPVLARHFQVISLANNHSGDYGHEAFLDLLGLLDRHHVAHFGGGRNCVEARAPHIMEVKGIRIALLAYNDYWQLRSFEAGPSWPGIAWCVDEQVLADIRAARTIHKADLVIPFMHWGDEEDPANNRQRMLAQKMIDAGADMVVGGHPHITQGAEYYKGKLIVYSLGNLVFDDFKEGPLRFGWLLRMRLTKKGLTDWDTVVIHTDDEGIPRLRKDAASPAGNALQGTLEPHRALVDSPFTAGAAR